MIRKTYYSIFIIAFLFIVLNILSAVKFWGEAKASVSSIPYQIGLTNCVVTKCVTSGYVCTGGTLCYTKDTATCSGYWDVSGTPAGGMGTNALFLDAAITKAGLVPGGELIAGCMSPTMCDGGVLASWGGCWGIACFGKGEGFMERYSGLAKINKFILALAGRK
jgi:hypothetical protein